MSVCDASLIVDALIGDRLLGSAAAHRLTRAETSWHAPHLLPAEVLSVLRRQLRAGHVATGVAHRAQERLSVLRIELHAFAPYQQRVWALRDNATAYDAWYIAIAEHLSATLVTTDAKMAGIPGIRCDVEVVSG